MKCFKLHVLLKKMYFPKVQATHTNAENTLMHFYASCNVLPDCAEKGLRARKRRIKSKIIACLLAATVNKTSAINLQKCK